MTRGVCQFVVVTRTAGRRSRFYLGAIRLRYRFQGAMRKATARPTFTTGC